MDGVELSIPWWHRAVCSTHPWRPGVIKNCQKDGMKKLTGCRIIILYGIFDSQCVFFSSEIRFEHFVMHFDYEMDGCKD